MIQSANNRMSSSRRRGLAWLLIFTATLITSLILLPEAQVGAFPGRTEDRGFFSGSSTDGSDQDRLWGRGNWGFDDPDNTSLYVNTIDEFVDFYGDRINGRYGSDTRTREQSTTIAAFTIHNMLGNDPGASKTVTPAQFNEWEALVRKYANAGKIDFNESYSFSKNTYYDVSRDDVMWYSSNDTRASVVFRDINDNSIVYAIKRDCANPVGEMEALPKDSPPIGYFDSADGSTCTVRGWALDPDHTGSIRVRLRENGPSGTIIATIRANKTRTDVGNIYGSAYNDSGWVYTLPNSYNDGNTYTIHAGAIGVDSNGNENGVGRTLTRSPKDITCTQYWDYYPRRGGRSTLNNTDVPSGSNAGTDYNIVYAPAGGRIRVSAGTSQSSSSDGWAESSTHAMAVQLINNSNHRDGNVTVNKSLTNASSEYTYGVIYRNRGANPPDHNTYFNVDADTPHGKTYCFRVGVNNHEGNQPGTVTASGWNWSSNRCWVVLQRYDIDNLAISTSVPAADLGETITINFSAENTNRGRNLERYSGGVRNASLVRVTTSDQCDNHSSTRIFNSRVRINGSPGSGSTYSNNIDCDIPTSLSAGDEFCYTLQIFYVEGFTAGYRTANGPRTAQNCTTITSGPYFGVDRGSVFAGLEMGTISPTSPSDAIIASSASQITGDWVGGVSEFAALALGEISGFSSSVNTESAADTGDGPEGLVSNLTFANSGSSLGELGGDPYKQKDLYRLYFDNFDKIPDLNKRDYGGLSVPNASSFNNSVLKGPGYTVVRMNGDLRLGGSGEIDLRGSSHDTVLLVNGNVRIDRNILLFSDAGYSSIDDIPSLTILVNGGTINIGSNVDRIEGTYMTTGDFNSCNNSISTAAQSPDDLSTENCDVQLRVNGLVVADRLLLKRTYGSTTGANTNGGTSPAEVFTNAPEVYLSPPPNPAPDLPDVSSLVDLPPLF